ncbi:hypothetical protein L484_019977 [Morus notabilis]|uniref:Uncharacterized protein n=1 Tax=Morus notabilis TaxID=981085 RepID=W9QXE5_9ROSA|nr:uncharacterized protein LOC21402892 [Morus notabilis]EXB56932.1 hypothetical protein L484_019977 [Morus notabilis]
MDNCDINKKRVRDADLEANSAESKRVRVVSEESVAVVVPSDSQLVRVDSVNSDINSVESVLDSSEAGLLQDDLLSILDESESPVIQGLDSVIRSFEEEISQPVPEMQVTSDSGQSQPELGYLLEASDDELGLPPTAVDFEEAKIEAVVFESSSDGVVLDGNSGMLLFEDEIPSYDSFEFGIGAELDGRSGDFGGEYVALGGLFDGWDGSYENGAVSEVSWRTESLRAM